MTIVMNVKNNDNSSVNKSLDSLYTDLMYTKFVTNKNQRENTSWGEKMI